MNGFVGEFLVLSGAFLDVPLWGILSATGVIWSACYMLWMYQRVFYGEASEGVRHHIPDFNFREWASILPLVIMMVWMGIYTQTFLGAVSETNSRILDQSKMNVPLRVDVRGTEKPILSRDREGAVLHRFPKVGGAVHAR
jgi:NADH-quinone oxidoreductase subunit M